MSNSDSIENLEHEPGALVGYASAAFLETMIWFGTGILSYEIIVYAHYGISSFRTETCST